MEKKRIEAYNFDKLLSVFTQSATPWEIRRDLTEVYFMAIDSIFTDGAVPTEPTRNALYTLQSIIQALETIEQPGHFIDSTITELHA